MAKYPLRLMDAKTLHRRIAHRTGVDRHSVRRAVNGFIAESAEQLLLGEELNFWKLCRMYIKWKHGKFRLVIKVAPAFMKRIEKEFVENREVPV